MIVGIMTDCNFMNRIDVSLKMSNHGEEGAIGSAPASVLLQDVGPKALLSDEINFSARDFSFSIFG